ncbi:MAG TPA: hypothetical protein VK168_12570 [Saprospiraceae bacterium]|nr:hypothetical protein [Saprospiraceae bacterium]
MHTPIVGLVVTLLIAGCLNQNQPLQDTSQNIQPEAFGTPNSEQQGNAFTISTEAFYQASINSSTSHGKVISLSLMPNRKAEMRTDNLDKQQILIDTGSWTTLNNGNLQLNLRHVGEQDSFMLEFKTDGDKLIYTGSKFGTSGLTLWVKTVPK